LLIPADSLANIVQDAIIMANEREGVGVYLGMILATIFGYAISYPMLFISFCLRFTFSRNTPIFEKSKKMASIESENFVVCFVILLVFILPFILAIPVLVFHEWVDELSILKIYVIYTALAVIITTIYTVKKSDITKCNTKKKHSANQ
jgi:hypothetical protein